jgi:DNA invertase Pin-like site-specific DNA recombinase
MNCAGYIRVSTEQQREEGSHENQRDRLTEWADREDHSIDIYEDIAISGQSDDREAHQNLMDNLGQYDAVVVRELSRWGRSLQKTLNDIDELDQHDVGFISLREKNIDTTTPDGRLLLNIKGALDQYWSDIAQERGREMAQRRKEQGKPVGRPKKLTEEQRDQVREWNEMGLGYSSIVPLVEDAYAVEVTKSTIYRYCNESRSDGEPTSG